MAIVKIGILACVDAGKVGPTRQTDSPTGGITRNLAAAKAQRRELNFDLIDHCAPRWDASTFMPACNLDVTDPTRWFR